VKHAKVYCAFVVARRPQWQDYYGVNVGLPPGDVGLQRTNASSRPNFDRTRFGA